jgi:hypothetical protein
MDWFDLARRQEQLAGICEHGNEPSGFIKSGDFLNFLGKYELLKKDSASKLVSASLYSKLCLKLPTQILSGGHLNGSMHCFSIIFVSRKP